MLGYRRLNSRKYGFSRTIQRLRRLAASDEQQPAWIRRAEVDKTTVNKFCKTFSRHQPTNRQQYFSARDIKGGLRSFMPGRRDVHIDAGINNLDALVTDAVFHSQSSGILAIAHCDVGAANKRYKKPLIDT
jgi:hypothetical protein